ncbi:MAG: hypothetical protein CMH55_09880 [Myxococcales bacterium]|nr:hypothetical protein [Myxococcales bacterium]
MLPTPRAWSLVVLLVSFASACGSQVEPPAPPVPPGSGECAPIVEFFEDAIWKPFLGSTCYGCHQEGGAGARASELVLSPVDPFAEPLERGAQLGANLAVARRMAAKEIAGESVLLMKPTGGGDHGGGIILPEGSRNLEMLRAFVERVARGGACPDAPEGQSPDSFVDEGDNVCDSPPVTARFDAEQSQQLPTMKTARLTQWQYRSVVHRVLGYYENRLDQRLPPDGAAGPIPNTQDLSLSAADFDRYTSAARHVAEKILEKDRSQDGVVFACARGRNRSCAEAYLRRTAYRLFRRPITDREFNSFINIYNVGSRESFDARMRYLIEALLVYPDTLYHLERGRELDQNLDERRLSRLEIVNRLAFFLTSHPPTEEMLDEAQAGRFDTDEGVESWARELLAQETESRYAMQHFHQRWLNIHDDAYIEKDEDHVRNFSAETFSALRRSAVVWAAYVALKGGGSFRQLMSSASTSVTGPNDLAKEYFGLEGAEPIDTYGQFEIHELPASERAGLITQPAFLASAWNSDEASSRPILRGANLLKDVFCDELAPPVNNFPPPERPANQTAADDLAFTVAAQPCKSCHEQMNPLGLALESYDAAGRYRQEDRGHPIVTQGEYGQDNLCDEERVSFPDSVAFARSLGENPRVQACYTLQWFRYALRRDATPEDAGSLGRIHERFLDSDLNIPELLVAIATSRSFLYRQFAAEAP